MKKTQRQDLGRSGEKIALSFLKKEGYDIVSQNYRTKIGEIDIIALDKKTLCFVEVKTRVNDELGGPLESISPHKQRKISQAALTYLQKHGGGENDFRFDVVGILVDDDLNVQKIDLIRNAFELNGKYFY